MTATSPSPDVWFPSKNRVAAAELTRYQAWLTERGLIQPDGYDALWRWSVEQPGAFWASVWDYFGVTPARSTHESLTDVRMPGSSWFPGERVNYARTALAHPPDAVALVARDETGVRARLTYGELQARVAAAAGALTAAGVGRGDRVAAVLSNTEETVTAFLATASIGAIWTLCSPEFGEDSIIARLAQTEPRVLLTVDAYRYNGRVFDVRRKLDAVAERLHGLETHIEVHSGLVDARLGSEPPSWATFVTTGVAPAAPVDVAFDHPLWILFSSGTTGIPKALVHGHGGIVLEHLKSLGLHNDVGPGDVLFWYTTTAWMMWNYVVGALLRGATAVVYDGAADPGALWSAAREDGVTLFGASPGFYQQSIIGGFPSGAWTELRTLGSTGSPLLEETHRQLADRLPGALVASVSGGTDVCSGFVGPVPVLPVTAGRMQRPMLGVDCAAFDEHGNVMTQGIGELVVRAPMPSMPLRLWGDDGTRYRETYFARYPGVWCHGDWIQFLPTGEAVISGRSDATLNRGGVRMGTSEFYRVVQTMPWIRDSLVVDVSPSDGEGKLVLFVVVDELTIDRTAELRTAIRSRISPRHVPDLIVPVSEVPYTLTGKKCEIPIKRMLLGARPEEVADPESLRNPAALTAVADAALALLSTPSGPHERELP